MPEIEAWDQRFLFLLTRAEPRVPPVEAFLFRRSAIARVWPGDDDACLLIAAAELLSEEGLTSDEVITCLRAALSKAPRGFSVDFFWDVGRCDLISLANVKEANGQVSILSARLARIALPIAATLTVGALACRL